MNLIDPQIPRWLILLFTFFLLLAIISLFDSPFGKYNISFQLTDFALILTLAILIIYTYFTYSIAKEAGTPSVIFKIIFIPKINNKTIQNLGKNKVA